MDADTVPELNMAELIKFGQRMGLQYEQYVKDRLTVEYQWLKNLRQFRGIWDPEVLATIPKDQSKAYPKITRKKVISTVARLMEMLFPRTDKNWGISPSPVPDLPKEALEKLLVELQGGDPNKELTREDIEKAIGEVAKACCARMDKEMTDQLQESDFVSLARRVVFSAVLYSCGVMKGPLVKTIKARTWVRENGQYKAVEQEKRVPYFEFVSVWDWYPDLSAKTLESRDGSYFRHVMSRAEVSALKFRKDFIPGAVETWLNANESGNYRERHWESGLRTEGDRGNVANLQSRKYELWEWWGYASGHELKAAGVGIADDKLHEMVEANVWGIGEVIIKCKLNPTDTKRRPEHVFIYEDDDLNLLGQALPQVMRDSQMAIAESARMILDNAGIVCGPNLAIRVHALLKGHDLSIKARKAWLLGDDDTDDKSRPAIENIGIDSHIDDLLKVFELFMRIADDETALPPTAMGDVSQGGSEALRTTGGASMLLGAAALPIRDTVRNFDRFTTSAMTALYDWNMQFSSVAEAKGDFVVIARGSTSLIAKEVRAIALDYLATSLQEDEKVHIKLRELLIQRMKVRDLDLDELMEDKDVVNKVLEERRQAAAEDRKLQLETIEGQVKKLMSEALKNAALAKKANASADTDVFTAVIEGTTHAADRADKADRDRAGASDKGAGG